MRFKELQKRSTTKPERIAIRREMADWRAGRVMLNGTPYNLWLKKKFDNQHKRCFFCRERIYRDKVRKNFHVDHRLPVYYGGTNDQCNLVLVCVPCNLFKGVHQLANVSTKTRHLVPVTPLQEQQRREHNQTLLLGRIGLEVNAELDREFAARLAREP